MYIQRYLKWFPAAGEVIIFDRSWYNRAGVETVMGFCTPEERDQFLRLAPLVEQQVIHNGITLIKYWLEVGNAEQKRRFEARIEDPLRQWKLSPMDLPSRSAGMSIPALATRCSTRPTPICRRGISCAPTTKSVRGSAVSPICSRVSHTKKCLAQGKASRAFRISTPMTMKQQ